MKLLKNKAFLGGICLLLAAVIAFFVVPSFFASQKSTVWVVRPAQEISPGTVITGDMVTTTEIGAYGLPERMVKEASEVIGKAAAEPIHAGSFFWSDALTTEEEYAAMLDAKSKGLDTGLCLVTIKFDIPSAGIAGVLRPGNIVNVYETIENMEDRTLSTEKVLDGLYVYDVMNDELLSLSEVDRLAAEPAEDGSTNYDFAPAYAVIRCTEAQAQTLIRLEKNEALHLTLQRTEG